jgi:hypothetical protein
MVEIEELFRERIEKWKKRLEEDLRVYEQLPIQLAEDMSEDIFHCGARLQFWQTRLKLLPLFNKKTRGEECEECKEERGGVE